MIKLLLFTFDKSGLWNLLSKDNSYNINCSKHVFQYINPNKLNSSILLTVLHAYKKIEKNDLIMVNLM